MKLHYEANETKFTDDYKKELNQQFNGFKESYKKQSEAKVEEIIKLKME